MIIHAKKALVLRSDPKDFERLRACLISPFPVELDATLWALSNDKLVEQADWRLFGNLTSELCDELAKRLELLVLLLDEIDELFTIENETLIGDMTS